MLYPPLPPLHRRHPHLPHYPDHPLEWTFSVQCHRSPQERDASVHFLKINKVDTFKTLAL